MRPSFKDYAFSNHKVPTNTLEDFYSGRGTPSSTLGVNFYIPGETHFISISTYCKVELINYSAFTIEQNQKTDLGVWEYSVSDVAWLSNLLSSKKSLHTKHMLAKVAKADTNLSDFITLSLDRFTNILADKLTNDSLQKSFNDKSIHISPKLTENTIKLFKDSSSYILKLLNPETAYKLLLGNSTIQELDMLCNIVRNYDNVYLQNQLEKSLSKKESDSIRVKKI